MRQSLKPILLAFLIIGGLFGGWYLVHNDSLRPEAIRDYLLSFGSWAPLVFIIGYIIGSVTLMPAAILSITGGLVFGPFFGTIIRSSERALALSLVLPSLAFWAVVLYSLF